MSASEHLDDPARSLSLPADRAVTLLRQAASTTRSRSGVHAVTDAHGAAAPLAAHALALDGARHVVLVVRDTDAARQAVSDLSALAAGLPLGLARSIAPGEVARPLHLVTSEHTPYAQVHGDRRVSMERAAVLFHLARDLPWRFCVVTAPSLLRRVVLPKVLVEAGSTLLEGGELDLERIAHSLSSSGYLRAPVVDDPGCFAVRGGLLDVWPAGSALPVRAALDGERIASLHTFDPERQRRLQAIPELNIPPAREAWIDEPTRKRARAALRQLCDRVDYPSTQARQLIDDLASGHTYFGSDGYLPAFHPMVSLLEYFESDVPFVIEDPPSVIRALLEETGRARDAEAARRGTPHFSHHELYLEHGELAEALVARSILAIHPGGAASGEAKGPFDRLESLPPDAPALAIRDHSELGRAIQLSHAGGGKARSLDPVVTRLALWSEAGLKTTIAARARTQADRIAALLGHRGVVTEIFDPAASRASGSSVRVVVSPLARGAIAPAEGFVLLTEEEIFGQRTHRAQNQRRTPPKGLEDLRALSPGDHLVHADHGIGRYLGLEQRLVGGVPVELLVVEYQGGDRLFLPVYRLNQVQKYAGSEGKPKLDRLGGQTFLKTKSKVRHHVRQMADELLRLYAERDALQKEPLPPPDDEYAAFEAGFPHDETPDQAAAIADVIRDLSSSRVMDRLVCGDVGFGKTEVALRAAFLCASAGRQVALLCPTTILAQQHFQTFASRLENTPLRIAVLSRFQTKTQQLETLKGLKQGTVDIVVGTHRLLSKDVHYKNLGLLVVDEEQRFGVVHKERIKQLRISVDVLTLSATPIPRTLQLAVGNLRDLSLIGTAPVDRLAVRTVSSQFDPELIRQAVERELARGGQVFYVYNRVEGIAGRAERLRELLPQARIAVGHGQQSEETLERTMLRFVAGEYDVLVATAIVESGLDIPRANTMIIDRADLFGLAQLYQLRGRVGRGTERAYCYLLTPPLSQVTDEARARLLALEQHSELGSGFRVAALDMELRGAGDVLGAEQTGFVANVGFDMFCEMLREAAQELRGETVIHEVDPELNFDVEALLPESYVADVGSRLAFYKRLAGARDEAEVSELGSELTDRFGPEPLEARRLLELMRLKTELRTLRVLGCEATKKSVTLHLRGDTPLDPIKISRLVADKKSEYRLSPDGRLTRRAGDAEPFPDGLALADRMLSELAACMGS